MAAYLTDCISDSHVGHRGFTSFLNVLGQELKLNVLGVDESGMTLVLWIDVMFDFRHGKFTVQGQMTRL